MNFFGQFDLLSVGFVVAATGILGFSTFFSNKGSVTNRTFLDFCIVTMFWGVVNYLNYKVSSPVLTLWIIRSVLFFAVFQAFYFFTLTYVFPREKVLFPKWYSKLLKPGVVLTALLTLTPFVFSAVEKVSTGIVSQPVAAPGIVIFAALAVGLVVAGIFNLIRRTLSSFGPQKKQFILLLFGVGIMFSFIIIFNLLFPTLLANTSYIPFSALFIFPFVIFTSYAILKHHLFNVKVAAIALVSFIISIYSFLNVIYADNPSQIATNIAYLLIVLVGSIFLIRSVLREIEQREKIEKQEKELEAINAKLADANERLKELDKQKTEFLSMASHQLRSPLTAIKGYASLILEGDYGTITDDLKHAVQIMFDSANTLAVVVSDYLNVTRIELGKMKYDFATLDLRDLVREVTDELRPNIEKAGLKLEVSGDLSREYRVEADKEKLKQVLMNIVDNSVKYTPKGSVTVSLSGTISSSKRGPGTVVFAVKDTGIGIAPDVLPKLFGKFVRANNANKQNIRGTGLGLFIAKQIVEAHRGRIWAESEGEGKGSQFYLELPLGK